MVWKILSIYIHDYVEVLAELNIKETWKVISIEK